MEIRASTEGIALCLPNKGGHTALYKINNNVHIKKSKIITVIILYSSHTTLTPTPPPPTPLHAHIGSKFLF